LSCRLFRSQVVIYIGINQQMKIGQKLLASTVLVSILIGGIGYLGVKNTEQVSLIFKSVETKEIPSLTILLELIATTRQASIKAMEYAMRGNNEDKVKAITALEKIKKQLDDYKTIEIHGTDNTKIELDNLLVKFSETIESYISLSKGPTLETVIFDEKKLHKARQNLIQEINQAIKKEQKHLSLELLVLKSEARRIGIKAVEFALRGNERDFLKANEALDDLGNYLQIYVDKSEDKLISSSITELASDYSAISRRYLADMSERQTPTAKIYAIEEEVHKTRRDLIHFLYPLIESEENELLKSSLKTHASVENTKNVILLSVLVVVGIAISLGVVIGQSVSRPIKKLNNAAHEVAKGNLNQILKINSKDEIGALANSFSHMTQELKEHRDNLDGLVKSRTRELEASNKELESFSYSIAHDLRAPLRTITSFSQIIKEDAEDKLDEMEKQSLERIIAAGKNMAELIEDILNLARISRQEMKFEIVDLSELVRGATEHFNNLSENNNVTWKISAEVEVKGDAQLLGIVLQNLLDNAFKYSSKKEEQIIEFGVNKIDNEIVYFVKDNGVGFDMQFSDKLFGSFQRLHGAEFEGTGIGLATVERIIHRHGGKIWAESALNEGAAFYFTLPT